MKPVLAIDIGGTKMLAALVADREVRAIKEITTPRAASAEAWCDALAGMAKDWNGQYACVGVAVTGLIAHGKWSALNPGILPVPDGFPLKAELSARLGKTVLACNDAQAAAWGEYKFGAGEARDMVFLTISTGIGGGVVIDGKLLEGRHGLGGSAGQVRLLANGQDIRIEDLAAGQWMESEANKAGYRADAKAIFEAAAEGQQWAEAIIHKSASAVALLTRNLQLLFAPELFVIGGGIGSAPGYLDLVSSQLAVLPPVQRPEVRLAALGKNAGIVGVADLAREKLIGGGKP
jgi:predicted NBD/HSP70 family sugar kinase